MAGMDLYPARLPSCTRRFLTRRECYAAGMRTKAYTDVSMRGRRHTADVKNARATETGRERVSAVRGLPSRPPRTLAARAYERGARGIRDKSPAANPSLRSDGIKLTAGDLSYNFDLIGLSYYITRPAYILFIFFFFPFRSLPFPIRVPNVIFVHNGRYYSYIYIYLFVFYLYRPDLPPSPLRPPPPPLYEL